MQIRFVTRPAIAAITMVLVWTATPRAGLAQQCRRTCETGETRDVRGCCVPAAKPTPAKPAPKREPPPRTERPAREEPKADAPAAKPSKPPEAKPGKPPDAKPSEPPMAHEQEDLTRARRRRKPEAARAGASETMKERAKPTGSTPAPEMPVAKQSIPAGASLGTTAPGSYHSEATAPSRTEPASPQADDFEAPPGSHQPRPRPEITKVPPPLSASQQKRETVPTRRWPIWMPWAVVGAGAVVTGVGEVLYNAAYSEYDSFDKKFSEWCPEGCHESEEPSLSDQLDRARTLETTSRISFIVGGATMAAGVALVFLNRPTESKKEHAAARTFVVPTLSPGAAGISAGISF